MGVTGPPVFAKRKVFTCFTADTKPAPNFLASGAEESEEKSIERFICCHQVISVAFKIMGEYIRADIPAESECGSLAARGYRAGNHDFHLIERRMNCLFITAGGRKVRVLELVGCSDQCPYPPTHSLTHYLSRTKYTGFWFYICHIHSIHSKVYRERHM